MPASPEFDLGISVLEALLQSLPRLKPQIYFKSSLTALSHAMEDQVLAGDRAPLIIASFQKERFYRQEAHRYERIAAHTQQLYVLAAPETSFVSQSGPYETVAFSPADALVREWHLVVLAPDYATCLVCREREGAPETIDQARRFEGVWSFERPVAQTAAEFLLGRIHHYRPELGAKLQAARQEFLQAPYPDSYNIDPAPFAERLVTYLQAGQYKLLKAYRSLADQGRREQLVNLIVTAIRRSLNPEEILGITVRELGQALQVCRCLIYRCQAADTQVVIKHEFCRPAVAPLVNQVWSLAHHPLFSQAVATCEPVGQEDIDPGSGGGCRGAWLLVPVLYHDQLLGMIELQRSAPLAWSTGELDLLVAVAVQVGTALIQAESYAHLAELNQQLAALDRTRGNLTAIIGHELRTPLSTVQICLESMVSDPDISLEIRQTMLDTALEDAKRLQQLVQDFLTLSHLDSGRVRWHLEPISIQECVDLALSSINSRNSNAPEIIRQVPEDLPLVQGDGEWLVEVLAKLLDNACKFSPPPGKVTINAHCNGGPMLEVSVTDTGRGIEPNRLEQIFDRFYQEEGALRRTAGGTGLGLAICRQIITALGGEIWAESVGKDQGSSFHFTVPLA